MLYPTIHRYQEKKICGNFAFPTPYNVVNHQEQLLKKIIQETVQQQVLLEQWVCFRRLKLLPSNPLLWILNSYLVFFENIKEVQCNIDQVRSDNF